MNSHSGSNGDFMKNRTLGAVLVCLAMLIGTGCVDPKDRRPGLRLSGDAVTAPVTDWSFSDAFEEIQLETKTWYLVPHSVTTVCASVGGKLYVPSVYFEGGGWPDKYWNSNVESDSRVRLRIGGKLYEREAVVIEDASEVNAALNALAAKYPFWSDQLAKPEAERFDRAIIRMDAPTS
jgi:hypothetical protein